MKTKEIVQFIKMARMEDLNGIFKAVEERKQETNDKKEKVLLNENCEDKNIEKDWLVRYKEQEDLNEDYRKKVPYFIVQPRMRKDINFYKKEQTISFFLTGENAKFIDFLIEHGMDVGLFFNRMAHNSRKYIEGTYSIKSTNKEK